MSALSTGMTVIDPRGIIGDQNGALHSFAVLSRHAAWQLAESKRRPCILGAPETIKTIFGDVKAQSVEILHPRVVFERVREHGSGWVVATVYDGRRMRATGRWGRETFDNERLADFLKFAAEVTS